MPVSAATGFWSYVQQDNANSQNHIRELSQQVKARFQLITGDEIEIFFDREDLKWGEAWGERIEQSIAGTTFFIPVITPSYFASEACRAEFLQFWQKVKESSLKSLLLPILYIDCDISLDSDDEICRAVAATQYVDWRELQLEDERSSAYKRGVAEIAQRLKEIAETVAAEPDLPDEDAEPSGDNELGVMEAVAIAEERFDELTPLLNDTQRYFFEFSDGFTEGMNSLPTSGRFATKIGHLRAVSDTITPPAEKFTQNAIEVKQSLTDIRDAVTAAADFAASQYEVDQDASALQTAYETADKFEEIGNEVGTTFPDHQEIQATLRQMTKLSRELRKPAQALETGMKNIYDCSQLFNTIADEIRSRLPQA